MMISQPPTSLTENDFVNDFFGQGSSVSERSKCPLWATLAQGNISFDTEKIPKKRKNLRNWSRGGQRTISNLITHFVATLRIRDLHLHREANRPSPTFWLEATIAICGFFFWFRSVLDFAMILRSGLRYVGFFLTCFEIWILCWV